MWPSFLYVLLSSSLLYSFILSICTYFTVVYILLAVQHLVLSRFSLSRFSSTFRNYRFTIRLIIYTTVNIITLFNYIYFFFHYLLLVACVVLSIFYILNNPYHCSLLSVLWWKFFRSLYFPLLQFYFWTSFGFFKRYAFDIAFFTLRCITLIRIDREWASPTTGVHLAKCFRLIVGSNFCVSNLFDFVLRYIL